MRAVCLCALLAAACAATPPPPGTLPRRPGEGAPWYTVATPHFELFTQLEPDETARLATLLEQARTAFLATARPLRRGYSGETARVVVVRGLERFGGSRRGAVGGMTSWQPEVRQLGRAPLVVLDASTENLWQLDSHALHELVHLLTESPDVDVPRWLHEATAYRQRPSTMRRLPVAFPPLAPVRVAPLSFADVRAVRALLYLRTVGPMAATEREHRARIELDSSFGLDPLGARALEFGWSLLDPGEARVRARATWQARPWEWRAAVLAASLVEGPEAVDILERTARWHPDHRYLEAALALAYWEAQRYPDARRLARQAVERDQGDPYLLGVYGQCLIAGSACEDGREAIAKALASAQSPGEGRHFPYDLDWLKRTCGVP